MSATTSDELDAVDEETEDEDVQVVDGADAKEPGATDDADQQLKLSDDERSGGFVADWVRVNFPEVASEAELQLEAADPEQGSGWSASCEECGIPSLSTHSIRVHQFDSSLPTPATQADALVAPAASTLTPLSSSVDMAMKRTQEDALPPRVATTQLEAARLALPAGSSVFFRSVDCVRWPRELLHGTLLSSAPATTSSDATFYHRVLWLRGVEALPNGFFRASLVLPGWGSHASYWPQEVGVFPTQLGALRAVVTAEQLGRAKFRRELAGDRLRRQESDAVGSEPFPSCEILTEIVAEAAATLGREFSVRLTRQDDARFHEELARGTWSFRQWMGAIGRVDSLREEDAVPFEAAEADEEETRSAPWAPADRIRLFLLPQHELVFPERICRQHLRAVLDQLLLVYAGFAWRQWREFVTRQRQWETQQTREHAACVLQTWTRRLAERRRQQQAVQGHALLLSATLGSSADVLELYRRRQVEARKLHGFLMRQAEEKKRLALQTWRVIALGPQKPPPPPLEAMWHPSHGMKTLLPKLPRVGARRRTPQDEAVAGLGHQLVVEDAAVFNHFRANHAGPTDASYWVICGRVLAGVCPVGPASLAARRLVGRADFATSVLLQQLSVFVCLLEPHELEKTQEMAVEGGDEGSGWLFERQVRTKYHALCLELTAAETVSKRLAQLARQTLADFDVDAVNSSHKTNRNSQQQEKDDAKDAAARELLANRLQLAEQQASKATKEATQLAGMQLEFLHFPMPQDGVPAGESALLAFLEQLETRLRGGKNLYVFSRLGHGRTGLIAALLLGRVYGITASEALERAQRLHDCQRPSGSSFCSPTAATQVAFVRRVLADSMDAIYAPLVLENSTAGFQSTRMQRRGLLAEPFLGADGFMVSAVGDPAAQEREALEQRRLQRIAKRESAAATLQRERRQQQRDRNEMMLEDALETVEASDCDEESRENAELPT
ncbi:hypothetical protein BBJ28_00013839 [Nothophytophthora sp. Chile5]|nr:hypothetical protein BBJ28_00013839 [Nothophytophthora sp. Chile5]